MTTIQFIRDTPEGSLNRIRKINHKLDRIDTICLNPMVFLIIVSILTLFI